MITLVKKINCFDFTNFKNLAKNDYKGGEKK